MMPVFLARAGSMDADYVVYHASTGPGACVLMVPESFTETPGPPYRSERLAAAHPWTRDRQYENDKARREAKRRKGA